MFPWLLWLLNVHAYVGSWVGVVKKGMRARRILGDDGILRQLPSVSVSSDLCGCELRLMLGLKSRLELDAFLKRHGVYLE